MKPRKPAEHRHTLTIEGMLSGSTSCADHTPHPTIELPESFRVVFQAAIMRLQIRRQELEIEELTARVAALEARLNER